MQKLVIDQFKTAFRSAPQLIAKAPGRINIIGEHVDYCDGLSLPCAIDRHVLAATALMDEPFIEVRSQGFESRCIIDFSNPVEPAEHWKRYVYGVVRSCFEDGFPTKGCRIMLNSNVPMGAGVSSSAALELAVINALNAIYQLELDPLKMVQLCREAERKYLRVPCGLLDHYASQFSKAGKIMLLDFQDLSHVYFEDGLHDYQWVTVNSMVERQLSGSAYADRVKEMKMALQALKTARTGVEHYRDVTRQHLSYIDDKGLRARMEHFVAENQRTVRAASAVSKGEVQVVGELLNAAHHSLSELYQVSCAELDFLAEQARMLEGCAGSRMMGGGFGGCTINLVHSDHISSFTEKLTKSYQDQFNKKPEIAAFKPGNGASVITKF